MNEILLVPLLREVDYSSDTSPLQQEKFWRLVFQNEDPAWKVAHLTFAKLPSRNNAIHNVVKQET